MAPPNYVAHELSSARRQAVRLRREVAGDVEDQLRDPRCKSIDLSICAGDDRHVGGDGSVQRVQRRDQGLGGAVGPQRQIAQRADGHDARVEDIGLRQARGCTSRIHDIHRRTQGSTEGVTGAYLAGVDDPTGLYTVERKSARPRRREIAIDVNDQVGVISRINRDVATRTSNYNSAMRGARAADAV